MIIFWRVSLLIDGRGRKIPRSNTPTDEHDTREGGAVTQLRTRPDCWRKGAVAFWGLTYDALDLLYIALTEDAFSTKIIVIFLGAALSCLSVCGMWVNTRTLVK